MIDAKILVEIRLKGHFGSMLAAMRSSTLAKGSSAPTLECTSLVLECTRAYSTRQQSFSTLD
jgi:hypothetical protein